MKYLLLSDTHGELNKTNEIIKKYPNLDGYFHLGDVGFSLVYLEKFYTVKGNHDGNHHLPSQLKMTLGERNVLCIHGNRFDDEIVKEVMALWDEGSVDIEYECEQRLYEKLSAYAKQEGCDTVFFGHSHKQCFTEYNGVTLINPGSVGFGINGSGYAIVEINGKDIDVEMISI